VQQNNLAPTDEIVTTPDHSELDPQGSTAEHFQLTTYINYLIASPLYVARYHNYYRQPCRHRHQPQALRREAQVND
jgi:hypothetical protein